MLTFRMNPNAFVEEITLQVGPQAKFPLRCTSLPGRAGPMHGVCQSDTVGVSQCQCMSV